MGEPVFGARAPISGTRANTVCAPAGAGRGPA